MHCIYCLVLDLSIVPCDPLTWQQETNPIQYEERFLPLYKANNLAWLYKANNLIWYLFFAGLHSFAPFLPAWSFYSIQMIILTEDFSFI